MAFRIRSAWKLLILLAFLALLIFITLACFKLLEQFKACVAEKKLRSKKAYGLFTFYKNNSRSKCNDHSMHTSLHTLSTVNSYTSKTVQVSGSYIVLLPKLMNVLVLSQSLHFKLFIVSVHYRIYQQQ